MLWSRAEASAGELRVRRGMISHRLDVSCGTTPRPVGRKGGSMPHRWPGAAGSSSTRCSRRIARRAGYVLRAAPLWRRRCRCRDGRRCRRAGTLLLGPRLILFGLLLFVEPADRRRRFPQKRLLLRGRQKTGRRLVAGFLPGRDHLAGARSQHAVPAARIEAERRQCDL